MEVELYLQYLPARLVAVHAYTVVANCFFEIQLKAINHMINSTCTYVHVHSRFFQQNPVNQKGQLKNRR